MSIDLLVLLSFDSKATDDEPHLNSCQYRLFGETIAVCRLQVLRNMIKLLVECELRQPNDTTGSSL